MAGRQVIPEAAVEAAAKAIAEADPLWPDCAWEDAPDKLRDEALAMAGCTLEAAAPHIFAMDEAKLAAIIVLLDPFERVTNWMATDDEAGHYAVEAINKIRAILDTP